MNATLRFNEALLITGRAFQPYQCVAWSELGSDGGLSLSVVDRTGTRLLGRARIPSSAYSDPEQLAGLLQQARVMVVQSWEEESRRLRGKDISPCRLLFLDEAARLDAKSIATLFELCDRLEMQLIIAAPENISPEKGTTYKLVRKVFQNHEHVHVVGLRGFAGEPPALGTAPVETP